MKLFKDLEIQAEYFKERRTNILQTRADIPTLMGFQVPPQANIGEAKDMVSIFHWTILISSIRFMGYHQR